MPKRFAVFMFAAALCLIPIGGPQAEQALSLTASEARNLTLTQSLSVQMAQVEREIGRQDLPAAKSIYDTALRARASYLDDKSQRAFTVFGTESTTAIYDVELAQRTPLGTELSAGFLNQRDRTNSPFVTVNPSYDSRVTMGLRQPMLRNAFGVMDRKNVQAAKKQVEALDHQTQARIQAEVYRSLVDYWNLYMAHHLTAWEGEALSSARELERANRRKLDIGLIEKPDLSAFEANAFLREGRVLDAKSLLAASMEQVRMDLGLAPGRALIPRREAAARGKLASLAEELDAAYRARPDYAAAKSEVEAARLRTVVNRNGRLPQMDVLASLDLNGIDREYSRAVENIGDGHPAWLVGMEVSFPIQNRLNRSQFQKSRLDQARKLLALKWKEMEINRQVTEHYQRYANSLARLNAAARARDSQREKMAGEQRKYEQGRSDSDLLIRYQNDYLDAKRAVLQAEVDAHLAWTGLQYVSGKILW